MSVSLIVVLVVFAIALFAVALVLPAPILQASCAVAGEKPPSFGQAWVTAILAAFASSIGSVLFSVTVGMVARMFVGNTLTAILAFAFAFFVYSTALSALLRIGFSRAAVVALVHHVIVFMISGVAGLVILALKWLIIG
jgi:hypothetical protein